jgi:hypothetical protein
MTPLTIIQEKLLELFSSERYLLIILILYNISFEKSISQKLLAINTAGSFLSGFYARGGLNLQPPAPFGNTPRPFLCIEEVNNYASFISIN